MAHCPACQTEIGDDFGLVNCPGCGVVCFVDLDGNASLQNEDLQNLDVSSVLEETTGSLDLSSYGNSESTEDPLAEEDSWEVDGAASDEGAWDGEIAAAEQTLDDLGAGTYSAENLDGDSAEEVTDPQGISLQEDAYSDDEANTYENYNEESLEEDFSADASVTAGTDESMTEDAGGDSEEQEGLEDPLLSTDSVSDDDEALDTGTPSPMSVDDFLNEIEIFSGMNSEPFQASAYFFDITISGIDSKDIRTEILETLSNSKLRLEEENLSKKIVAGQLQLFQIPAVKAAVIIQSLAHLNCDLDWKLKEAQDLGYEDTGIPLAEDSLEGETGEELIAEDNDSFDDLIESYDDEESLDIEDVQDGEEYDSEYGSES